MNEAYKPLPAAEELWSRYWYKPLTGELIRKSTCRAVGTKNRNGYLVVGQDKRKVYMAHRLIWKWVTGKEPKNQIDHRNGDKADNRLVNLREATPDQNSANQKLGKRNTSGLKGVRKRGSRWDAQLSCKGVKFYLGSYATPEEAHQAYCRAAADLHGDFARVR